MTLRKPAGIVVLAIVLPLAVVIWYRRIHPPDYSICSMGGASMFMTNWPLDPFYLQTDKRWADETVGGSHETVSDVGCTICCISMAFTHFGVSSDPKELNAYLKQHEDYSGLGWVKWDAASAFSDKRIIFEIPEKPTIERIDESLRSGEIVIAKVLLGERVPHWVLVAGKNGHDYLVKNPLNQKTDWEKLSDLSSRIQSIRIVRKVQSVNTR